MSLSELEDWLSRYRPFGGPRLPKPLESAFIEEGRESQRKIAVFGVSVGIFLYLVLLPFDRAVDGSLFAFDVTVRLGIGLPLMTAMLWLLLDPGRSVGTHRLAATLAPCIASTTFSFVFAHSETIAGLAHLAISVCTMAFAVCLLGVTTPYVVAISAVTLASMATAAAASPLGNANVALSFAVAGMFVAVPSTIANHWLHNERRRNFVIMRRDGLRLECIAQQQAMMEKLAAIDPLTQVANRRGFDAQLDDALAHSPDGRMVVAMIDVDCFKLFNDTYGHPKGDDVLRAVALTMAETCGSFAYVGRIGGEEFAVAAVGMAFGDFVTLMEKLRRAIERLQIVHTRNEAASVVTVSIGVASGTVPDFAARGSLFQTADGALYEAKISGRNRVRGVRPVLPVESHPAAASV